MRKPEVTRSTFKRIDGNVEVVAETDDVARCRDCKGILEFTGKIDVTTHSGPQTARGTVTCTSCGRSGTFYVSDVPIDW